MFESKCIKVDVKGWQVKVDGKWMRVETVWLKYKVKRNGEKKLISNDKWIRFDAVWALLAARQLDGQSTALHPPHDIFKRRGQRILFSYFFSLHFYLLFLANRWEI